MNKKRLLAILLIVLELGLLFALYRAYGVFQQGSCTNYLDFVQNFQKLPQLKKYRPQLYITEGYTAFMLDKNINTLGAPDYIIGVNELYKSCSAGGKNVFLDLRNLQKGSIKPTANEGVDIAKSNPKVAQTAHLIALNQLLGFDKVMDRLEHDRMMQQQTQPAAQKK